MGFKMGIVGLPNGAKATSSENVTLVTVVAPSGMADEEPAPAAEGAAALPAFIGRSSPWIGFDAPTARPERYL